MPVIDSHHRLHVAKPSGALLYIRDGLEAMWDGIENAGWGTHDNTLTTWKDLVGGYDGTLATSGVSWSNDSLSITGNCHPCIVPNGIGTILNTKNFTIEISNKSSNRNRRGTLFGNYNADGGNGFNIEWRYGNGTNYTYRAYFNGSPDVSTTELYALNAKQTITLTLNGNDLKMYHNGVIFYSRSNQSIRAPGITQYCLGGEMGRTNMVALGNLYAVRIYSRALSQDEIEANFRLDTERTSVTSPYTKSFIPVIYHPSS